MRVLAHLVLLCLCSFAANSQISDTVYINSLNRAAYNTYLVNADSAIELSLRAFELSAESDYDYGRGFSAMVLSRAFWTKGNFMLSTEYGFKAVRVFNGTTWNIEKSLSYLALARTLIELGNHIKAREFILDAIRAAHKIGDEILAAEGYREYSYLLAEQTLFDSALYYCDLALPVFEKHKRAIDVSILYGRMSRIFFSINNFEKSREFAYKGMPIDSAGGNNRALGVAKFLAAQSEHQFKNSKKAFELAQRAIQIFEKLENHQWLVRCHQLMASLYKESGNLNKAIIELELVSFHKDQLSSSEKSGQIEEMQALYELSSKEKTILLLENENKLKAQQVTNQRLVAAFLIAGIVLLVFFIFFLMRLRTVQQRANQELTEQKKEIQTQAENLEHLNNLKTKLFSVISHDLRGPISNIKVLFSMIANQSLTKEEFLGLSVKLKSTVDNTHRTLENLLNWCLTQMDGIKTDVKRVELVLAIDEACKLLEDTAASKKIKFQKEISPDAVVLADSNQVQLILRNLIHNAIKFSKPESNVQILATHVGDFWRVAIQDSGTGMSNQEISMLLHAQIQFTKYGTNQEKGTGLGLMLCKEFIKQNNGKLEIESAFNQGTSVSFYLPISS